MFNITDQATWVEIIQDLETTDPLLGGIDGHLTQASQGLANRTLYLKNQIETLAAQLLSGMNASTLGGKTKEEITAEIIAAISGGASTAYDTLLELQNAIQGNDGDITSVLNTLSHKANEFGDANKTFKIANAVNDDEALSKGQFDAKQSVAALAGTIPVRDTDTAIAGKNQCTAWASSDGDVVVINDHFNLGTIVRNGTGNFSFTFDTEMANANYSVQATGIYLDQLVNGYSYSTAIFNKTTTSFDVQTSIRSDGTNNSDALQNFKIIHISVFGGK